MAGSFGYEARHYDASMQTAEASLLPAVRCVPETIVVADGTGCRQQIAAGAGREAVHAALADAVQTSSNGRTAGAARLYSRRCERNTRTNYKETDMPTREILISGIRVLVEVDDLDRSFEARPPAPDAGSEHRQGRGVDMQNTSTERSGDKLLESGSQLRMALSAVAQPVADAMRELAPAEWTLEVQLGFKGEAGVPCIVKGEANGSLKVTVKWTRDAVHG